MAGDLNDNSIFNESDPQNNSIFEPSWPEGMEPSQVNNQARALQASVKRFRDWLCAEATVGGTANAITLTFPVSPYLCKKGDRFLFFPTAINTGPATITIGNLGPYQIQMAGVALIGGEIVTGSPIELCYDGTRMQVMRPLLGGISGNGLGTWSGNVNGIFGIFTNLTVNSSANINALTAAALTVNGSSNVRGITATSITDTGNATVAGTLSAGATTLASAAISAGLSVGGSITATGNISGSTITAAGTVNGNILNATGNVIQCTSNNMAVRSTPYHILYAYDGNPGIYLGSNADPTNYFRNVTHHIQNTAGSVTYASFNSFGISNVPNISSAGTISAQNFSASGNVTAASTVTAGTANVTNLNAGGSIVTSSLQANGGGSSIYAAAGNVQAAGALIAGSTLSVGTHAVVGGGLTVQQGGTAIYASGGNIQAAGALIAGSSLAVGTTANVGGQIVCSSSIVSNAGGSGIIAANGDVAAAGRVWAGDSNLAFYLQGSDRIFNFAPNWYWAWSSITGDLAWQRGGGGNMLRMEAASNITFNDIGPFHGFGPYLDTSDHRTKQADSIAAAEHGLDTIKKLKPVKFKREPLTRDKDGNLTAREDQRTELGFIAQDLQKVLPEAVLATGHKLPDGSGGMDDENPTLAISSATIIPVLVNAMQEIADRIEKLEKKLIKGKAAP